MIELSTLYAILLPFIPTITALVGMICAIVRTVKNNKETLQEITRPITDAFNELREEVKDKAQAKQTSAEVNMLLEELRLERELTTKLIAELTKRKHEDK